MRRHRTNRGVARWAVCWILGCSAAAAAVAPSAAEPPPPLDAEIGPESTLDDLIRHVERASPGLLAADHHRRAAAERIAQAGAVADPMLAVHVGVKHIETRVGPQQGGLTLEQTLPGFGKRDQRETVARADSLAAEREYEQLRRDVVFRVAEAYYDLYLLERSIEITRDNRDILVYVEQIVRKAYETGKAPYADLIRSQVEIGKLENDLRSLTDQHRASAARLNALLHRDGAAALPAPRLDDRPMRLLPREALARLIDADAPEVRVIEARLAGEAERLRLARIEDRTDWTFSVTWIPVGPAVIPGQPDSGQDAFLAGLAVRLPLWRKKYDASVREANERHAAALETRGAAADRLAERVEALVYRFENADREIRLYRDTLLPKSEQSLEASQAGLRAGSVSVLDLVDTTRVLLQFELAFERAKTERAQAEAELRSLLGAEVLVPDGAAVEGEGRES